MRVRCSAAPVVWNRARTGPFLKLDHSTSTTSDTEMSRATASAHHRVGEADALQERLADLRASLEA